MRILRVAGMLIGLAAALLGTVPAAADETGPAVDLTVGWASGDGSGGGSAAPASWIPFTTVVNFPPGRPDWSGTLTIRPKAGVNGGFCAYGCGSGVTYEQSVSGRSGSPRTFVVYGQYVSDSHQTYEAVLRDSNGATVATSGTATLRPNDLTIGVLSDAPSADSLFRSVVLGTPTQTQVRGHRFDKAENLPSNALALTGFHAIVIDDFDTTTLSQAQLKGLQDYVGFGGALVISGGSGWRRTLGQLPPTLVPLRPESTTSASLGAVTELLGINSDAVAAVAVGTLAPGARVVLSDSAGTPLMAEMSYGSGRIVELTYDPAVEPVFGTVVATQSWTQAFNRGVSTSRFTGLVGTGPVPVPIASLPRSATGSGSAPASGSGGTASAVPNGLLSPVPTSRFGGGLESQVLAVLANSPAAALPPLGLLGALLVGYVVLAGPANYLWVRRRRRRELTWVTVPLIAVLFTGIAYGAGSAYKGSDFVVNEIQLLRVAPGGSVDATLLDAVFNARRGDFIVQAPDGSFVSTAGQSGTTTGARPDHVSPGRRPAVALNDVAVWSERSLKIEAPIHAAISLETHLGISGLRVKGTITNRGGREVRNLALLTVSGEWAALAPVIGPGATLSVDSPLGRVPDYGGGPNNVCNAQGCFGSQCGANGYGCPLSSCSVTPVVGAGSCKGTVSGGTAGSAPTSEAARTTLAELAAGAATMGRPDLQAIVGIVDPLAGITVQDSSPIRHSIAAVAEPVLLESIDVLPAGWAGARPVTSLSNGQGANSLSVWDFDLPGRIGGNLVLQYGQPGVAVGTRPSGGPIGPATNVVEVYDWSAGHWSRLASDVRCPGSSTFCAGLTSAQTSTGMVRVRTRNSPFFNFQMQLLSTVGPGS